MFKFVSCLELSFLLLLVHSVDHVEDVAPVHAVEPVAQNVIFADGTNLTKTTCKFIFQLEVRLAHFVDFAANFGTFGNHSFLFLPLFLDNFSKPCSR